MSRRIALGIYKGPWRKDDKDANFKQEVAQYCRIDPMSTLDRLSQSLNIPVGALVRYILVKWASAGSAALLDMGPLIVRQMGDVVRRTELVGSDKSRLEAYNRLAQIISWLQVPLDSSDKHSG